MGKRKRDETLNIPTSFESTKLLVLFVFSYQFPKLKKNRTETIMMKEQKKK